MHYQRPTIFSQTTVSYYIYFYPSIIHNYLSLIKVIHICFYHRLSSTEDDSGGL